MVGTASARVLLVSAVASGQGKTSVTAALARKLVQRGQQVRVFKCGPDFIDPMLLARASGAPVDSLDLWMVGLAECRSRLAQAAREADVILIEGVMGLYDGTPSSADLAREFKVPVMAVIDASAMAQTAGALVQGLRDYGPVDMAGVIANRIASPGHAAMVAASLRGIPLFGTLGRQDKSLPERHLGLVMPAEQDDIEASINALADGFAFDDAAWDRLAPISFELSHIASPVAPMLEGVTVAIARDAAFAFLYPANLATLSAMGARLTFFSPLADEPVPPGADAVWLPGGYPELHGAVLSQAQSWKQSMAAAHARGVPILAECGGMMVLADSLVDQHGDKWPMAGLLPGQVAMQERLAGLGSQGLDTLHGVLRGHTFHYSQLATSELPASHTLKHPSGAQGEAVYRKGSLTASYFHAYFPSCPQAVAALLTGSSA
ncbi:cobyrinate a,c-diamide synthase [Massilia sp. PAMC28688]|uniref:cobyrinate a,c-diamide synthase n=1 Tax=Massilia sp. PAMC28688 TaxID=2861283 RepID=UPI001C629484|nr:cobyrinate a,c-diamide synthase [Massilia sp. PAMC28688]QYF94595.1 cobyrinate a,c-diamide synthase [Massilia sp. PAMC28688]